MYKQIVSTKELADILGVHVNTIFNLMKKGLPAFKVGRQRRYNLVDVFKWLEPHEDPSIKASDDSDDSFLSDLELKIKSGIKKKG